MAETTAPLPHGEGPRGPAALAPIAGLWQRITPSLVPVFAVLSALILTIPFMVITSARGDIGRGLNTAFTAYSAFIEGSLGVAINNLLTEDDTALVVQFAQANGTEAEPFENRDLRAFARRLNQLVTVGSPEVLRYADTVRRYEAELTGEDIDDLGGRIEAINAIGGDRLRDMGPFLDAMSTISSGEAANIVRTYSGQDAISDEDRAAIDALVNLPADISNAALLADLRVVSNQGTVRTLQILTERLDTLDSLGIDARSQDAQDFVAISRLAAGSSTGSAIVLELDNVLGLAEDADITDIESLARQLSLVDSMYQADVLTDPVVEAALNTELPPYIAENFVVYRPGNVPLLVNPGSKDPAGIILDDSGTSDIAEDDQTEAVYLQLGGSAALFFPANLERTLVRSIPFIIAGLAVALGFKAGLFNIGAEGQLYMGALLAVWIGYSPIFDGLPAALRVPLVLVAGIIGGGLWGMIPGVLKAYSGAHEVINTIMLNFIAIRFVDWMIRSSEPLIMRDPAASTPRTPFVAETAKLPTFDSIALWWFLLAGVLVLLTMLYSRRGSLNVGVVVRAAVYGLLVIAGGAFLSWLSVNSALHLGLLVMVAAVYFTDWLLNRTTPGFELRTVGANPDAARYAGMNVKWNIALALTLSGALAGLAGAIEIASVEGNMKPAFFSGLGFDAIAVALLARTNPRNMIPAGLLWASLVTGAGLMQVRADIANDLVKVIQALIIMFIAADAIVRWLWRVPEASEADRDASTTFSKGWGG